MTLLWLLVWIFDSAPHVSVAGAHNVWGVALLVCLFIDLVPPRVRARGK